MINSCMCHIPLATHKPQLTISAYRLSGDLTVANMRKPYCRGSMFLGWQGFSKVSSVPQGPEREPRVRISSLDEGTFDDADGAKAPGLAEILVVEVSEWETDRMSLWRQKYGDAAVAEGTGPASGRDGDDLLAGFRATTTRKSNSSAGMGKVTAGLGK
ncbi:hypothetical protein CP532_2078 [Ophiocordyceps camponoti-leonardi (nom. inval.)]|nr:hypothetical protein CP532_2078 [Ophiocordyceps camponoti-leonardi (nom. inval.)]